MHRQPPLTRRIHPSALVVALLVPALGHAGLLDDLKAKAQQTITNKAEKKAQDATSGASAGSPSTPPAEGGGKSSPADAGAGAAPSLKAYQNYDFSTGDRIVFEDEFKDDALGEFPARWNMMDGQGAVNETNGRRAMVLTGRFRQTVSPAIKAPRYLGDSFTIEFDAFCVSGGPAPVVYFYDQAPTSKTNDKWIGRVAFSWNNFADFSISIPASDVEAQQNYPDDIRSENFGGRWRHFAIAYRSKRLKVYVDQYRIWASGDLAFEPKAIAFDSAGDQNKPGIYTGIRIANGSNIQVVAKKFTDAKIVSYGIHFDIDRATLRPESMGALNAVLEVLKNNPDLKFEVQGHTDNSGGAARNLTLSQQRAETVRTQLVSMGVDAGRLTARGLGDTAPVGSNDTPEGRANNRRVEFVRR